VAKLHCGASTLSATAWNVGASAVPPPSQAAVVVASTATPRSHSGRTEDLAFSRSGIGCLGPYALGHALDRAARRRARPDWRKLAIGTTKCGVRASVDHRVDRKRRRAH